VNLPNATVTFTTRQGGVSEGPYESLNLGILTDDDPVRVRENRRITAGLIGMEAEQITMGWQVHGTDIRDWTGAAPDPGFADPGGRDLEKLDGHITRDADVGLLVMVADCFPVALSDGEQVAMLHCGWRPLAGGILEKALGRFDGTPAAAVGPGIGGCCYEVGEEVHAEFAAYDARVGERNLDLATVATAQLRAAGVEAVHDVGLCTMCCSRLFFSHRRDRGVTGRQAGVAWRA
jgi:polyphenol oxidase